MHYTDYSRRDISTPAGVYDYVLGGTHNTPADRAAAQAVIDVDPTSVRMVRHNRDFLGRAVHELTVQGFDQFLDIGSGFPTAGNVHEIAQAVNPQARVVYVDANPVVHHHSVALLDGDPHTAFVCGDIRKPDAILQAPETSVLLDLERPVAVLMVALLHFVPDEYKPARLVETIMAAVAPGSRLVVSHLTSDDMPGPLAETIRQVYGHTPNPLLPRPRRTIESFFGSLELLDGRLDDVQRWHNPDSPGLEDMRLLCGVGVKR